ncbi:MAG: hypothetical protein FWG05_05385, partial [Kiritimatiellaeota bacterium]|nr:hypothetical protein [Kiritimatiellota bacterium]
MRKTWILAALGCAICARESNAQTAAPTIKQENTKWEWTGWGGGGFFWSAVWDQSDENTLYLGGDVIGIYKSTDRGLSWKFVNNGLQNYGVYTLAASKSSPKVLYAMTENGIARTDNGGESWQRLHESMNSAKRLSISRHQTVRGIAIDPTDAKTVYAGSARGEVHKSTNGGESWTQLDFLSAIQPEAAGGGVKAPRGKGFLYMRYASGAGDWTKHGRIEKFFAPAEDWSGFDTMSAKFRAPANAPRLTAMPVVQSGAGWGWQEGNRGGLEPGGGGEGDQGRPGPRGPQG